MRAVERELLSREQLMRVLSACRYRLAFVGPRRVVAVVVTSLGLGVLAWFVLSPTPTPVELVAPRAAATTTVAERMSTLVVHVAGAVKRPGVYEVPGGSRVIDALQAAGGPLQGADLEKINLAVSVADAEQIFIPRRSSPRPRPTVAPRHRPGAGSIAPGAPGGSPAGPSSSGGTVRTVNVNTATSSQLESLPGIGPSLARAIVAYRTQKGAFTKVEDLLNVPGIGAAKLAAMRDEVRVD